MGQKIRRPAEDDLFRVSQENQEDTMLYHSTRSEAHFVDSAALWLGGAGQADLRNQGNLS